MSESELEPRALAELAVECRSLGTPMPEQLTSALQQLTEAGPPYDLVAAFIWAVGDGGPLPEVPEGLSEEVDGFLRALHQAAEAADQPQVVDTTELAMAVLDARRGDGTLPETARRALAQMRAAGDPHSRIAEWLRLLAGGGPLPGLPPDLPAEAHSYLEQVLEAARRPQVDVNQLADAVLEARNGEPLDQRRQKDLELMRAAGPPHEQVAELLQAIAGGETPKLDDQLPEDARAFVESVLRRAETGQS